jgi:hypothetical protein
MTAVFRLNLLFCGQALQRGEIAPAPAEPLVCFEGGSLRSSVKAFGGQKQPVGQGLIWRNIQSVKRGGEYDRRH